MAVASALTGKITDPRDMGIKMPEIELLLLFLVNDNMIIPPLSATDAAKVSIIRKPILGNPPFNKDGQPSFAERAELLRKAGKHGISATFVIIFSSFVNVLPVSRKNIEIVLIFPERL